MTKSKLIKSQSKKDKPPKLVLNEGKLAFPGDDFNAWCEKVKKATGTDDKELAATLAIQLCEALPNDVKADVLPANAALAMIHGIHPGDELEAMLAIQMVAVHNITMEMANRCVKGEQSTDIINSNINCTTKLMRTFTTQVETLNRYRGKGQQKVTVEHVHVNDGGQAVVGNIDQGGRNNE